MTSNEYEPSRKTEWKRTIFVILVRFILAEFCIWLIVGCTNDDNTPVTVDTALLVYLAGDNNLSGESNDKLQAIAKGYDGSSDKRILIYHDTKDESPYLYEITAKSTYTLIEQYEEENSADSKVFSRVIFRAKSMYPQATFSLLVFSHASGWLPSGSYSNPSLRSVLMDNDQEMELSDFASAIPDRAFNSIVFEACNMAGIEVAYELKDKANYIAASSAEIVYPGFTHIYQEHIHKLSDGNTPEKFMREVFGWYDAQSGYLRSATFSVIYTPELDALAAFVRSDCDFTKDIAIDDIQSFDRKSSHLFFDFEDYYSRLLETEEQRQELQRLTEACVIWKASTPCFMEGYSGFTINRHSGLTCYLSQERYRKLNEAYKGMKWYQAICEENN